MPTLVGHREPLFWGLALASSLFLGGLACATADDVVEATTRPAPKPLPAPSIDAQRAEPEVTVAPADDVTPPPGKQVANDSHRRRTVEPHVGAKSSRRAHGQSAVTESPIERLRHSATNDVELPAAPTHRPTLAEVMRRLAGWTDSCPLCDQSCPLCGKSTCDPDRDLTAARIGELRMTACGVRSSPKPSNDRPMLGQLAQEEAGADAFCRPLRAGEPAQVILDTQRQLGKSVLEGTEFGGSPELLIQWIRALDDENRRQQAMLDEVSRADVEEVEQDASDATGQSQIEALRHACRQLQEAADLLEEQNLFESADSVREIADALRVQSREKVGEQEARRTTP